VVPVDKPVARKSPLDDSKTHSALERIKVAANLRHDLIEHLYTEAVLDSSKDSLLEATNSAADSDSSTTLPFLKEMKLLWSVTAVLCKQRELVRGKPEARNRADYQFRVDHESGHVEITERQRNAPLDRIVAEMMIMANNQWGKLLAAHITPGIYRSQQMGRVRMTSYPQPHQGLGVTHYGWFTSPLRRYSDLVNQRQLLAVLDHEAPPYIPNDAGLHAVIAAFDARYASYNEFQNKMERYWCLRWLDQQVERQGHRRFEAVVVKPEVIRFAHAPLYVVMNGLPELAPGRSVLLEYISADPVTLDVQLRFVQALDHTQEASDISEEGDSLEVAAELEQAQSEVNP
jgi:exoribonuclease II